MSGHLKADTLAAPVSELSPRLGLNFHRNQWPTAPALKAHEAAGFAWVQVHTPPREMLAEREPRRRHATALRAALDTCDLRLVLHAPDDLSAGSPQHDRAIEGLLDYAHRARAEFVVYHGLNFIAAREDSAANAEAEAESLARFAVLADSLRVVIAIENLAPVYPTAPRICHDPLAIHDLVRTLDAPSVGMLLDLGHAHISAAMRGGDASTVLCAVGPEVVLFHVHDNLGARRHDVGAPGVDPLRLDLHLPPGAGSLPWDRIGKALRAHHAPLMLEIEHTHRPELVSLAQVSTSVLTRGSVAGVRAAA
jgi:sugar phosphate isomerase/epimerase